MKTDLNGNLVLKSFDEIKKWDTKRVLAYKNRLHKHLSYIQTPKFLYELIYEKNTIGLKDRKRYLETYISSLKKILSTRENVEK